MLNNLLTEVGSLWSWVTGVIAGLGVTATILIVGFVVIFIQLRKITKRLNSIHNSEIADVRDLSLRIRKLEEK